MNNLGETELPKTVKASVRFLEQRVFLEIRSVVYVKWMNASSYTIDQWYSMDLSALKKKFLSPREMDRSRQDALLAFFKTMDQNEKKVGFTFKHHYQAYTRRVKNPYNYTPFLLY
ncbi:MAG: hypothetical protein OXC61_09925 [Flavobacteriaceae bacterium]|nr:hypothetical protein [Flavobacteriaceae bacterium]